jgi:hypothetical protein
MGPKTTFLIAAILVFGYTFMHFAHERPADRALIAEYADVYHRCMDRTAGLEKAPACTRTLELQQQMGLAVRAAP